MTTANSKMAALMDPRLSRMQLGAVAYAGFPVRKITQKINANSGEWVIAYQTDQRRHLQAVIVPLVAEHSIHQGSKILRPPTNTREASGVPRKVLDRLFLLKHCYGQEPGDLCVCNVSSNDLRDYKIEDFTQFDNVVSINASDNFLPLEAFHTFPALEELELSLNGIAEVAIEPDHFATLCTLDLSYNLLCEWALLALGTLPKLKELHLTGNNIVALPVEMSRPYPSPKQLNVLEIRYPSLEKLWLNDNKLTDQATFATLAGMRKLRYLNLDNNEIFMIPHLKLLGTSPLKADKSRKLPTDSLSDSISTPEFIHSRSTLPVSQDGDQERFEEVAERRETSVEGRGEKEEKTQLVESDQPRFVNETVIAASDVERGNESRLVEEEAEEKERGDISQVQINENSLHPNVTPRDSTVTPTTPPLYTSAPTSAPLIIDQSTSPTCETEEKQRVGDQGNNLEPVSREDEEKLKALAPFPQLETLSLVNNMILREEGVLACCTWPMLKELIIYNNPLTKNLKGMPPLLKSHLVDECGVKVVRKKPGFQRRPLIGKAAKDFKKVSSAPPPVIPKYPLLALEAPPTTSSPLQMLEGSSSFSRSQSPSSHVSYDRPASQSSLLSQSESSKGAEISCSSSEASRTGEAVDTKERDEKEKDKDSQGVFLTQVDGEEPMETSRSTHAGGVAAGLPAPVDRSSVGEVFRERKRELRQKFKDLPSRYRGYEVLMDTFEDPAVAIPKDVYGCTRALQHALKHPLVLSDSSSKCPSVSSHSGSSQAQVTGQYLKKKPTVMAVVPKTDQTNHKVRQLQEVLDEVKTQCNTLEANVGSLLNQPAPELTSSNNNCVSTMAEGRRSIAELQKESKKLLAEMQARYDEVRAQSLSSLQAMSLELQRQTTATPARKKRTPKSVAKVTFTS